jgi:hypothetical protein
MDRVLFSFGLDQWFIHCYRNVSYDFFERWRFILVIFQPLYLTIGGLLYRNMGAFGGGMVDVGER